MVILPTELHIKAAGPVRLSFGWDLTDASIIAGPRRPRGEFHYRVNVATLLYNFINVLSILSPRQI